MGQSGRSGSTFSLPGKRDQQKFLRGENNFQWWPRVSPKSSSAVELASTHTLILVKTCKYSQNNQEEEKAPNKMRHSNSQALFPSQPLMKASRFDAIRARNAADHIDVSDIGGEMNSSIHFTIEENSGEIGFLSSMNASR